MKFKRSKKNTEKKVDDYDMTKDMLKTLRGENKLDEEAAEEIKPGMAPVNDKEGVMGGDEYVEKDEEEDVDAVEPESDMLKKEEDNLEEHVSGRIQVDTFKVYPKTNNAIMAGKLPELGNMHWQYTLDEFDGIYVTIDNLKLTKEAFDALDSLRDYYKVWEKEWSKKVKSEYKTTDDEEEEENET